MSNVNDDEFETLAFADESEYGGGGEEGCERCGHFHGEGLCPDPQEPCGDYRCCIN